MRYLPFFLFLLISTSLSAQSVSKSSKNAGALEYQHTVAFTPFSGIVAYGEFNPGIGFAYEYMISPENGIGLHIPFAFGFVGPEQDYNYGFRHTSYYAAPGIRFHTGNKGTDNVDFATGPAILIGNMHFQPADGLIQDPYDYNMFGFMADNSLNFNRGHFQFGLDVGVGALLDEYRDSRFFIHFGMHFGGRF